MWGMFVWIYSESNKIKTRDVFKRMIYVDQITRQRVVYAKHCGDLVYDAIGDKAISEETVPIVGSWEDYTGSAILDSRLQQINAGRSNELEGTDAAIEGARVPDLGIVGQNIQTTRRRQLKKRVVFYGD